MGYVQGCTACWEGDRRNDMTESPGLSAHSSLANVVKPTSCVFIVIVTMKTRSLKNVYPDVHYTQDNPENSLSLPVSAFQIWKTHSIWLQQDPCLLFAVLICSVFQCCQSSAPAWQAVSLSLSPQTLPTAPFFLRTQRPVLPTSSPHWWLIRKTSQMTEPHPELSPGSTMPGTCGPQLSVHPLWEASAHGPTFLPGIKSLRAGAVSLISTYLLQPR